MVSYVYIAVRLPVRRESAPEETIIYSTSTRPPAPDTRPVVADKDKENLSSHAYAQDGYFTGFHGVFTASLAVALCTSTQSGAVSCALAL